VLNLGRILIDDTPENIRQSEMLQEVYFGRSRKLNGQH
jgi:hypothetical protein